MNVIATKLSGAERTPTTSQFLNAAHAEYSLFGQPADLSPFRVGRRQLTRTHRISGMSASAWKTPNNQVIVAYQGTTGGDNALLRPYMAATQVLADLQIMVSNIPPAAAKDAADFAETVVTEAAAQGIPREDVFVTGHSLGGIEAQYAAQHTGLGGVSFEATGIPPLENGLHPSVDNFVNVVTYGDPVGNFASDIPGEQPLAPVYAPEDGGMLPHYGQVLMVGDPNDQTPLAHGASEWARGGVGRLSGLKELVHCLARFHLPAVQAHDLGVTLTQTPLTVGVNWFSDCNGPVIDAAQDTIPDLLRRIPADQQAPPSTDILSPAPGHPDTHAPANTSRPVCKVR